MENESIYVLRCGKKIRNDLGARDCCGDNDNNPRDTINTLEIKILSDSSYAVDFLFRFSVSLDVYRNVYFYKKKSDSCVYVCVCLSLRCRVYYLIMCDCRNLLEF